MVENNPHTFSKLSTGTLTQLEDEVDYPHSGLFKALVQMSKGNIVIKNGTNDFDITQSTYVDDTTTIVSVSGGSYFRDGKLFTVSGTTNFNATAFTTTHDKGYHILVVNSSNTVVIRQPTAADRVPNYTTGDTIIALIEISSTTSYGSRLIQFLTTEKTSNSVNIGYDNSGVYTEAGEFTGSATGVALDVGAQSLTVSTTGVGDALVLKSTEAGATDAPDLVLYRNSSSPAASDEIGSIRFRGKDDGANDKDYARIVSILRDVSAASTDADIIFKVLSNNSEIELMKVSRVDGIVINEIGANYLDTRIESDSNAHMFFVDASANAVGIGQDTPTAPLHVKTTGTGDALIVESTDADATGAPDIVFYRNSATQADADDLGHIKFRGRNSANSGDVEFVDIYSEIAEVGDSGANKAARLYFRVQHADSITQVLKLVGKASGNAEVVVNDNGDNDISFRVEGDTNANLIYTDPANDRVGIGTNSPTAPLHVETTGTDDAFIVESTEAGATDAPDLILYRNSGSPAVNDTIGSVKFRGKDAGGNDVDYVELETKLTDVTDGSEDSKFQINMLRNGAVNELFTIGKGECVINEASTTMEFRVESATNTHMFFVDAHAEGIGIQNSAPTAPLHIKTTGTDDTFIVESTSADANHAPDIIFYRNSASAAINDGIGHIKFRGKNDAGTPEDVEYADFYGTIRDSADGAEDGELNIRTMVGGTLKNRIHIDPAEIAINEDSASLDFRVESNGNANMLFVDASADAVGIGLNTPSATLDLLTGGTFRSTRLLTVSVSGSTTLTEAAHAGRYNICAGNITLPSTSTAGEHYAILNTTGGNITIGRNGNNINGAGSDFTLATFKAATCIAIGSNNWMVVG